MAVIGGHRRPPAEEPAEGDAIGVPEGQPVYREGESDHGRHAAGRDGTDLGTFSTAEEAGAAERSHNGD